MISDKVIKNKRNCYISNLKKNGNRIKNIHRKDYF